MRFRRAGFTLFEVMLALTMLSTFGLVAMKLVSTSLRVSHDAGNASNLTLRFDGALDQIRRDVWGATKIETPDALTLRVETGAAEGVSITWSVADDGSLVRAVGAADDSRQEWSGVARGITFEADGPVLLLVEPPGPGGDRRRVPLASQVALARGGTHGS